WCRCVDIRTSDIGIWNQVYDFGCNGVPAITWNEPSPASIAAELRFTERKWIKHRRAEEARLFLCAGHCPRLRNPLVFSDTLIISEPEQPIAHDWTAERRTKLISLEERFGRLKTVREEVACIKCVITEEFISRPSDRVRPRTNYRIDDCARTPSELRGGRVGLNLEFLQRLN